jgi:hypothetical protein
MFITHSNNAGGRSSPTPESSQPKVTQTALRLTNASANTDTEATVVAGKRYRFTALIAGGFYFGLATVATAGNVRWVAPLYRSVEIEIPIGYTTLHYATDAVNGIGYLVELL